MASIDELNNQVRYAQNLVRQAEQGGLIDGATARQHLAALGAQPAGRAVVVNLRLSGDVTALNTYNGQVNQAVEQALAGAAQRAGLTVEAGSVRVTLA